MRIMIKPKLTLVDCSKNPTPQAEMNASFGESPRQLSLFPEDERNRIVLVAMGDLSRSEFREILENSDPVAIADVRKYPDFFGFYRSTQIALRSFEQSDIKYIHAPIHATESARSEDLWEVRQSAANALQTVRRQTNLFGNTCLMLTSSSVSKSNIESILSTLAAFNAEWHVEVV
jgi:hypothetical protein